MAKEEVTTIEMDDGIDDFDDLEDEMEESEEFDVQAMIDASVQKAKKQANAYTDQRISKVNEKISKLHSMITETQESTKANTEAIENLTKVVEALAKGQKVSAADLSQAQETAKKNPGILDSTLGAVGGVLHGVVDTAAFLLESTVDLVTLGRARRQ
jgi:uncharacterized protein YjgD (DUF1641 family)